MLPLETLTVRSDRYLRNFAQEGIGIAAARQMVEVGDRFGEVDRRLARLAPRTVVRMTKNSVIGATLMILAAYASPERSHALAEPPRGLAETRRIDVFSPGDPAVSAPHTIRRMRVMACYNGSHRDEARAKLLEELKERAVSMGANALLDVQYKDEFGPPKGCYHRTYAKGTAAVLQR